MPMQLPPWLAQSADPASHWERGIQIGAQIGAQQAAQAMQRQQMAQEQQRQQIAMQQRAIEFSLSLQDTRAARDIQQQQFAENLAFERQRQTAATGLAERQMENELTRAAITEAGELKRADTAAQEYMDTKEQFDKLQSDLRQGIPVPELALRYPLAMSKMNTAAIKAMQGGKTWEPKQFQLPSGGTATMLMSSEGDVENIIPDADKPDKNYPNVVRATQTEIRALQEDLKRHMGRTLIRMDPARLTKQDKALLEDFRMKEKQVQDAMQRLKQYEIEQGLRQVRMNRFRWSINQTTGESEMVPQE